MNRMIDLSRRLSVYCQCPVGYLPRPRWSTFRIKRMIWITNLCWAIGLGISVYAVQLLQQAITRHETLFQRAMLESTARERTAGERVEALLSEIDRLHTLNLYTSAQAIEIARHMHRVLESGRGNQMDFLEKIVPEALKLQITHGIPASATIAMGIYESNYGRAELASKYHNYFGIKAFDSTWKGSVVLQPTRDNGRLTTAKFRCYPDLQHSVYGYGNFLRNTDRYAVAFQHRNGLKFTQAILAAGYCPDADYLENIQTIMKRHYLTGLDLPEGSSLPDKKNPIPSDSSHLASAKSLSQSIATFVSGNGLRR